LIQKPFSVRQTLLIFIETEMSIMIPESAGNTDFTSIPAITTLEDATKILKIIPLPVCVAEHTTGRIVFINQAFEKLVGLTEREILGKNSIELGFFNSQDERVVILREKVSMSSQQLSWQKKYMNFDNVEFYLSINSEILIIHDRQYVVSTSYDLSEQMRMEKEIFNNLLLEKEDLMADISAMAKVGGWQVDIPEMTTSWTDEVAKIHDLEPGTKISVEEGIGFYHENSREKITRAVNDAIEKLKPFDLELQIVSAKGVTKWVRTIGKPIMKDGHLVKIIGTFQDITERKDQEAILVKNEKRFRALIENSADVIVLSDPQRKIKYVSPAVRSVLGYSMDELLGTYTHDFMHPDDLPGMMRLMDHLHEKPGNIVKEIQCRLRHKKGHWIWVEGIGSNFLHDPAVRSIITNFHDISARKEYEAKLNKHTRELELSNKELERFAYVTSHDLQEPLRMVSSFLQLLKKKYEDKLDDSAHQYIRYAVEGSERMKLLITDLLNYSRVGTDKEKPTLVNITNIIENLKEKVFVEKIKSLNAKIISGPIPEITGYYTQLNQLFQNLISNALKYKSDKDPVIRITCEDKGTHWQLAVEDNGIGIDENFYEKIFIIFQRLHARSEFSGTGIGLAICKKIVEKHKGKIWVTSEKDKGSIFYFTISKLI